MNYSAIKMAAKHCLSAQCIVVDIVPLTFRPSLATFAIFHKWAKNSKKVKAIALSFRPFSATFSIFEKGAKIVQKVRLNFRPFLATFSIFHKWA